MNNKKSFKFRIILSLALAAALCTTTALATTPGAVTIPDSSLRQALLLAADADGNGSLSREELAALTGALDLSGKGISDITGLEFLTGVTSINLSDNTLRSLSALTPLSQLTSADVSQNYLDLSEGSSAMADIATLSAAGCAVTYTPQKAIPLSGISLPNTQVLCPGDTHKLKATFSPTDAANKKLTWRSSNTSVATVSGGTVSAVSAGEAVITAKAADGGFEASCRVTIVPATLSSALYSTAGGRLKGVKKNSSVSELYDGIDNDSAHLMLLTAADKPYTGNRVMTGLKLQLMVNSKMRDTLTVIVNGDTSGDGNISIADYTQIRLHILGLKSLSGAYLDAADVNNDGKVTITDYTVVRLDILGLKPIGGFMPDLPEAANARIRRFIDIALAQQGKPYVWGARGPDSFDCSGLVHYCLNQEGYSIGRMTADSYSKISQWQRIEKNNLQPGDLMFYWSESTPGRIGHVGIYLGNGYHIHATSSLGCVIIGTFDGYYDRMFSHGRRVYQ